MPINISAHALSKATAISISDRARVIVVTGKVSPVTKQLELLSSAKQDMQDRHIVVLRHNANRTLTIEPALSNTQFFVGDVARFDEYARKTDFGVYLIGKDGGLKKTWKNPVLFDDIAIIIDQMPMRKNEANSER